MTFFLCFLFPGLFFWLLQMRLFVQKMMSLIISNKTNLEANNSLENSNLKEVGSHIYILFFLMFPWQLNEINAPQRVSLSDFILQIKVIKFNPQNNKKKKRANFLHILSWISLNYRSLSSLTWLSAPSCVNQGSSCYAWCHTRVSAAPRVLNAVNVVSQEPVKQTRHL